MVGFMGIGIGATKPKTFKRKDSDDAGDNLIDRFSHHFSDFSLSSPARKIRRLDADLPPIMEEEEPEISPPPAFLGGGAPVIEELDLDSPTGTLDSSLSLADHKKAIVLFKPLKSSFLHGSPSNISLSVDSNFISGFKDQLMHTSSISSHHEQPIEEDSCSGSKECLAVVPWAPLPSHLIPQTTTMRASAEQPPELMDAEGDSMEIEEGNENKNNTTATTTLELGQGSEGYEGLAQQWQQQHCMVPQPPHNTSTPITWFPVTQHHY